VEKSIWLHTTIDKEANGRVEGSFRSASWTGILREGRIETMWHVVVSGKGVWEDFLTGADTFERIQ
jgi:hypothetical protein